MSWDITLRGSSQSQFITPQLLDQFRRAHPQHNVPIFIRATRGSAFGREILLTGSHRTNGEKALPAARALAAFLRDSHNLRVRLHTFDFPARTVDQINALLEAGK